MESVIIYCQGGQVFGYASSVPLKVTVYDYDIDCYDESEQSADENGSPVVKREL